MCLKISVNMITTFIKNSKSQVILIYKLYFYDGYSLLSDETSIFILIKSMIK